MSNLHVRRLRVCAASCKSIETLRSEQRPALIGRKFSAIWLGLLVLILLGVPSEPALAKTSAPTKLVWTICHTPFSGYDCPTTEYASAAEALQDFINIIAPYGINLTSIKYTPIKYWCLASNGNSYFCDGKSGYSGYYRHVFDVWTDSTRLKDPYHPRYGYMMIWAQVTCPTGMAYNHSTNLCETPAPKDNGGSCPTGNAVDLGKLFTAHPINIGNGNKYLAETDYSGNGPFPLTFRRYYNSSTTQTVNMGMNWRHNFDRSIISKSSSEKNLYREDGKVLKFVLSGSSWVPDKDVSGRLTQISGGWLYANEKDENELYDANGRLISITNRAGSTLNLSYDANGNLAAVTDKLGRSLTFAYAGGVISRMTVPDGGVFSYRYKDNDGASTFGIIQDAYGVPIYADSLAGILESVTYPDGTTRTYHYNEQDYTSGASLSTALTGITDESNVRHAIYHYDAGGRANHEELAGGVDTYDLAYTTDASGNPVSTIVTDSLNAFRTYNFQTILGVVKSAGQSQPGGSGCGPASSAVTYDVNGNVASRTDFNGNKTTYSYDLARNLETSRTEGLTSSGATTPQTRTITTAWHASFRLPVKVTEAGRETSYSYDTQGNLTQKSIRDTVTNATRSWNWSYTYSSVVPGLIVQKVEDGPRTDVNDLTTIDYHDADATCDGGHTGCRGQVSQVTNALGHVTHITRYNAHGQPEEIIDPNGLVTTLAYDARQRMVSRSVGSELTAYEYDPAGQLVRLTRPDTSVINFTYDAAHRLTGISDSLGNRISYTLDAMGNLTREDVHDPDGQLVQTRSREYDALNRLYRDIGAAGQATAYAYDATGNLRQITDPLTHSTGNNYDALDRLVQVTNPDGGQTRLTQDALDRVVSVTDPKGVTTAYTYNGLGDLIQEVSADRGTMTYTYDSTGNLLTRTDARGAKHTYTYDALNRPISRSHTVPKGVKGIPATASLTKSYDTGPNGIGRLTGMADETGSTAFSYDNHGRLLNKVQTATSGSTTLSHTLGFEYDSAGRLARQTYPSGAQVDLSYGVDGRPMEIRVNGQVLISDIVYHPFGSPKAWIWGNGQPYTRSFDADGRLDQYPLGNDARTLGFDAAGRIVSTSHANLAFNRNYDYDAADRLTSEVDNIGVSLWTYDLNSNRTSAKLGSSTYAYAYPAISNRVTSVAGPTAKTYSYDAAGNITSDGTVTFTYNAAGRLSQTARKGKGSSTNTYQHNALGQRIIKSGSYLTNGPYAFLYDEAGHLVGEYDASNALRQETVWLGDTPVAVLKQDAQGQIQAHYVHADHLDTPRAVVDGQGRMVWRWLGSAFGQNLPEEDPDGDGTLFEYNLRFPGQYYDKETRLHYNYFRNYDPGTGRYVQSDPIGLEGGMNTFGYVSGNPVNNVDIFGLMGYPNRPSNHPQDKSNTECKNDCKWPITITWTTGLPGARIHPDVTKTYSGWCLITLGLGLKGTVFVSSTVALEKAPKLLSEKGFPKIAAGIGKIAVVSNNPITMTISGLSAIDWILEHCECNKE